MPSSAVGTTMLALLQNRQSVVDDGLLSAHSVRRVLKLNDSPSEALFSPMTILIRSLQDAEAFILRCYEDSDYGSEGPVGFSSCVLHIRLDPGDGKTNRHIDRARLLLQRHVDQTYLLAKTGSPFGRLSDTEKDRLSICGAIAVGSTNLTEELAKSYGAIRDVLPGSWSHRRRNVVAVAALLLTAGSFFSTPILQYLGTTNAARISGEATIEAARVTSHATIEVARIQADAQIATAKLQSGSDKYSQLPSSLFPNSAPALSRTAIILAQLADIDVSNVVQFSASDAVPWRFAILNLAPQAGTIEWNGSRPIPATVARAASKQGRAEALKQRRIAKENGRPGLIPTPWVTEVLRTHSAPGAMRLGAISV